MMPPIVRTLLFRVDACPDSPLIADSWWLKQGRGMAAACIHDAAVDALREKLARQFRLKRDGGWIEAPFDDAFRPFLDHIRGLERAGTVRFGSGTLTERLAYVADSACYRLAAPLRFNDRNRKAGATEVLDESWCRMVSGRFRRAVEAAGLSGLTFGEVAHGPIPGDPRGWFTALPTALAGRGLDHDWAPPRLEEVREGDGRLGAGAASNATVRLDRLDPAVAELCGLFPPEQLRLTSFPRLWADALGTTDFAAIPRVDGFGRWVAQEVVLRRSAAEALLQAGVIGPELLEPVEVVADRSKARTLILDEVVGPLPASLVAAFAARQSLPPFAPPPPPRPSRSGPLIFTIPPGPEENRIPTAEVDAAAEELGITVPAVWRCFLSEIGSDIYWHPAEWAVTGPDDDLRAADATLPERMLAVGSTGSGDVFMLDLDHVTADGDCPILFFDHEINECVDQWPSAFEFVNGPAE